MEKVGVVALAVLVLMLGACGTSGQPQSINGHWFAAVNNPDRSSVYPFTVTLAQGSGATVNVMNFVFVNPTTCFNTSSSEAATFSVTGRSHGLVMGTFTMTISTMFPNLNNVLTLQGTRNSDGSISGTWNLTGQSECVDNGTFTM